MSRDYASAHAVRYSILLAHTRSVIEKSACHLRRRTHLGSLGIVAVVLLHHISVHRHPTNTAENNVLDNDRRNRGLFGTRKIPAQRALITTAHLPYTARGYFIDTMAYIM